MSNKISLIAAFLTMIQLVNGQKLLEFKAYDTTVYVYKLDNEQMDFIAKRNYIGDTSFLFSKLYKKFSRNSNYVSTLPYGNFIVVNIDQARVDYKYVYKSSFQVKHKVIGNDVILFINDKKSRENVSTAKVQINDVLVPFNEGYGGYAFDKTIVNPEDLAKNKAFLNVTLGDEYCIMRYNFISAYKGRPNAGRSRARDQNFASSGYIISDKPVYRPGDTLRVKAFLTNPHTGLPFKKQVLFTLHEPTQRFIYKKN